MATFALTWILLALYYAFTKHNINLDANGLSTGFASSCPFVSISTLAEVWHPVLADNVNSQWIVLSSSPAKMTSASN